MNSCYNFALTSKQIFGLLLFFSSILISCRNRQRFCEFWIILINQNPNRFWPFCNETVQSVLGPNVDIFLAFYWANVWIHNWNSFTKMKEIVYQLECQRCAWIRFMFESWPRIPVWMVLAEFQTRWMFWLILAKPEI